MASTGARYHPLHPHTHVSYQLSLAQVSPVDRLLLLLVARIVSGGGLLVRVAPAAGLTVDWSLATVLGGGGVLGLETLSAWTTHHWSAPDTGLTSWTPGH